MNNIARFVIIAFVFTIPWENMIVIPGFGTISRLVGMLAFGLGILAFLLQPTFRNLQSFHVLFLTFAIYSAASYAWSADQSLSLERIHSNLQLILFVWLVWQFIETENHVLACIQSYVFGAVVASIATIKSWQAGVQVVYNRYSAEGFDPNELSIILSLAIPLAWYLSLRQSTTLLVWANRLAVSVFLVAILLTGSRTGGVVACVGLLFILFTMSESSTSTKMMLAVLVVVGIVALPQLIPASIWERMATVGSEVSSGTLNHRTTIWAAGFDIWLNHLAFGVGAGAFRAATQATHGFIAAPHNSFLSILVELGAVGFLLLVGIMLIVYRHIMELPTLEKKLYLAISLVLVLGLFTLTWETKKPVWLLCSLILCHFAARYEMREVDEIVTDGANGENDVKEASLLLQKKTKPELMSVNNGIE